MDHDFLKGQPEPVGTGISWFDHALGETSTASILTDRHPEVFVPSFAAKATEVRRRPRRWVKVGRGKRKGDGAFYPGGLPEFLDDFWNTLEVAQKIVGRLWGIDVTERWFLQKMRQQPGESVLRKMLRQAGLTPTQIKSGKINRSNYIQFANK